MLLAGCSTVPSRRASLPSVVARIHLKKNELPLLEFDAEVDGLDLLPPDVPDYLERNPDSLVYGKGGNRR